MTIMHPTLYAPFLNSYILPINFIQGYHKYLGYTLFMISWGFMLSLKLPPFLDCRVIVFYPKWCILKRLLTFKGAYHTSLIRDPFVFIEYPSNSKLTIEAFPK